ncbi:MAG: hypothetical protein JNM17_39130 [Archangium sp.]|nr:hypothetical protein [Archangium sp.]
MTTLTRRSLVHLALGAPLLAHVAHAEGDSFVTTLRVWSADATGVQHLRDAARITPASVSGSLALDLDEAAVLFDALESATALDRLNREGLRAARRRFVVTRHERGELHAVAVDERMTLVARREGEVVVAATSVAVHGRAHEAVLRWFAASRVA